LKHVNLQSSASTRIYKKQFAGYSPALMLTKAKCSTLRQTFWSQGREQNHASVQRPRQQFCFWGHSSHETV